MIGAGANLDEILRVEVGLMLTREGARLQVFLDLRRRVGLRRGWDEILILDEQTIERPWGWVFFWNTRGSRRGIEFMTLAGNAPYLIHRDGEIRFASTSRPIAESVRDHENELERRSGAWELVIEEPADCGLMMASHIRAVLQLSVAELGSLKGRLPLAVRVGARDDLLPVCQELVAAGVRAEVRRAEQPGPA